MRVLLLLALGTHASESEFYKVGGDIAGSGQAITVSNGFTCSSADQIGSVCGDGSCAVTAIASEPADCEAACISAGCSFFSHSPNWDHCILYGGSECNMVYGAGNTSSQQYYSTWQRTVWVDLYDDRCETDEYLGDDNSAVTKEGCRTYCATTPGCAFINHAEAYDDCRLYGGNACAVPAGARRRGGPYTSQARIYWVSLEADVDCSADNYNNDQVGACDGTLEECQEQCMADVTCHFVSYLSTGGNLFSACEPTQYGSESGNGYGYDGYGVERTVYSFIGSHPTPSPTPIPTTPTPTAEPTPIPTATPTAWPTVAPTPFPTAVPTPAPIDRKSVV